MRRKTKRKGKWRKYETEKKALADRGLTPAAYEKAIKELSKKHGL